MIKGVHECKEESESYVMRECECMQRTETFAKDRKRKRKRGVIAQSQPDATTDFRLILKKKKKKNSFDSQSIFIRIFGFKRRLLPACNSQLLHLPTKVYSQQQVQNKTLTREVIFTQRGTILFTGAVMIVAEVKATEHCSIETM